MAFLMFLVALGLSGVATGGSEDYQGKESWGYINVRPGAYMFWWLYYTDVAENYSDYPLIIWLQGGPGSSSTGFGNFGEIGPYDVNLKPRATTWVRKANLLFLDNPVGTGYSYVTNTSLLCKNNSQIASDLLFTVTYLLQNLPEFQKSPLYIFSESYGGKMAADFSIALYKAIKAGKLVCNFKGVAFGDSWISPLDSVSTWGQYLYTMSLISKFGVQAVADGVDAIKKDMKVHNYTNATVNWNALENIIENLTNNGDWYNILKHEKAPVNYTLNKFPKNHYLHSLYNRHVGRFYENSLNDLMNGKIRQKLHVIPKNVTWGGQSADVFAALSDDFMKSVVDSVDALLNETDLSINVYNGQLDLIVDTIGTLQWVEKLKWPGTKFFMKAKREPFIYKNNNTAGFVSSFKNFHFFWILNAGHMIPADAGEAALLMLDMILPKTK